MRRLTAYGVAALLVVVCGLLAATPSVRAADPAAPADPGCDWSAPKDDARYPLKVTNQPNSQNENNDASTLDVTVMLHADPCLNRPPAADRGVRMVVVASPEGTGTTSGATPETLIPLGLTGVVRPGKSETVHLKLAPDVAYRVTTKVVSAQGKPPTEIETWDFRQVTVAASSCHGSWAKLGLPKHPISCIINTAMEWVLDKLLWLQDRKGSQALNGHSILDQILTTGAAGDLTNLCTSLRPTGASPHDCSGDIYAGALAPYAGILAMVLWGLSILRSVYVPDGSPDPGATLGYLTHHLRTGLLTLAGVWLAYPASRFLWELCSAASNAMVYDIAKANGGNGTLEAPLAVTTDFLAFPPIVQFFYVLLIVLEVLFVAIWMLGSTVAVLIGSIFGSFAVATGPMSGLGGTLGRWMNWMTRFLLLRLFLPPIAAILIGIMRIFSDSNGASVHAALFGVASIVFMIAIIWVTGQAMGFLMQGLAGAGRTIPGMLRIRFR